MSEKLEEKIAEHCDGSPSDYQIEDIEIEDWDEYVDKNVDKTKDELPVSFSELELDDIEEL